MTDDDGTPRFAPSTILPLLWAKTAENGYHPLHCHLLDVGAAAEALWARSLSPAVRAWVAAGLGVQIDTAGHWVSLFAALHDTGKLFQGFQAKDASARSRLEAAGLAFALSPEQAKIPHGTISAAVLPELLATVCDLPAPMAARVAVAVGGHHGAFPSQGARNQAAGALTDPAWRALRQALVAQVGAALALEGLPRPAQLPAGVAVWLAGFVSVADWIGSNQEIFRPYAVDGRDVAIPPVDYLAQARRQAAAALDELGWDAPSPGEVDADFAALFAVPAPNPMQETVIGLGERLTGPCLVAIEAQTGSGKTEAALWLADRWARREGRVGGYLALPTRATSDQMLGRLRRFLQRRYPAETINLLLLHGHANLSAEFGELRRLADRRPTSEAVSLFTPAGVDGPAGYDGATAGVVAAEWFTFRKRGLLAPFGVGTIDQALLAVLQTRHFFVRLCGLAGKTVVFDEVHAYDVFMSTLLEQTLRWLAALGTSVVLLSATLPAERRAKLVAAYQEGLRPPRASFRPPRIDAPDGEAAPPYPRVTWASAAESGAVAIPRQAGAPARRVDIVRVDGEPPAEAGAPFPLGARLRDALAGGGCAAVICNTVGRAQEVYRALKPYFPGDADDGPELDLLHARFIYRDREVREHRALRRFGKPGGEAPGAAGPPQPVARPWRAVLVATQVIEQSLDLDFDLLITDLAPVDLILQRIGRLHRHPRPDRPAELATPRVWIRWPALADGVPAFGASGYVYEPHVLLRSWLAVRDRDELVVPDDIEGLIEAVYDDGRPCPVAAGSALGEMWEETFATLCRRREAHQSQALRHLIRTPATGDALFQDRNEQLEEDDPSIHRDLQALTRLAEPSVGVVCLTPDERARLLPPGTPTATKAATLLRYAVAIGNRRVICDLLALPTPPGWKRSALLRHHRLLALDAQAGCTVGKHRIVRNDELGITIEPVAG